MSRIENVLMENEVADSLIADLAGEQELPQEQPEPSQYAAHGDELLNEEIAEQDNPFKVVDYDLKHEREPEQADQRQTWDAQQEKLQEKFEPAGPQQESQSVEVQQLSPEQVHAAVQRIDSAITEFNLNDDAPKFALEMAPFLGPAAYQHSEELANLTARATLGARDSLLAAYQSGAIDPKGEIAFEAIPPVHPLIAHQVTQVLADSKGINLQMSPAHSEAVVANALNLGFANLLHTANRLSLNGQPVTPETVNSKEMCVNLLEALHAGLHGPEHLAKIKSDPNYNQVAFEQQAVKFVNAITARVLPMLPKINQGLESRQSQAQKARRPRSERAHEQELSRRIKIPKMATNTDLFDRDTLRTYKERGLQL
jgi:hypothetical protein